MSHDSKAMALGWLFFMVLATVGIWLVLSAISSFIALDWVSFTDIRTGRGIFAIIIAVLGWRAAQVIGEE